MQVLQLPTDWQVYHCSLKLEQSRETFRKISVLGSVQKTGSICGAKRHKNTREHVMTTKENWNNGPDIQLMRIALAKFYAELTTADILVKKTADSGHAAEPQSPEAGEDDALAAKLRTSTVVPLNRADTSKPGLPRYDNEIHRKMQAELEVAFAHLKRV